VNRQYVANDVDLGNDGKAILLTGPNMGGKSCYLRQVSNLFVINFLVILMFTFWPVG
jgi:DNA mismatch repair ATPase MutS